MQRGDRRQKTDVELKGTLGTYSNAKGPGLAKDLAGNAGSGPAAVADGRHKVARLLDALLRIPRALKLADHDNLTGVVGVVCADMGNRVGDSCHLSVIRAFDKLL